MDEHSVISAPAYDYSPEEKAVLLLREEIARLPEYEQIEVAQARLALIELVQEHGDSGLLALSLLCAEIDNGESRL